MKSLAKKLVFLVLLLNAGPVMASPFCVQRQGITPECIYDDAVQCRKQATQAGGLCVNNPLELKIKPGIGKYCLVDSARISQCIYNDRTSCEDDAVRNGAVCIEATSGNIQPNPYESDPNSKY